MTNRLSLKRGKQAVIANRSIVRSQGDTAFLKVIDQSGQHDGWAWLNADETRALRDKLTELLGDGAAAEPERVYVRDGDEHLLHFSSGPEGTFRHLRCVKGFCEVVADPADFHPAPEPAPTESSLPRIGSRAVIVGNNLCHGFANGTVVDVTGPSRSGRNYTATAVGGRETSWFVAESDLADVEPAPAFAVGDRVRLTADVPRLAESGARASASYPPNGVVEGALATVRRTHRDDNLEVDWDNGRRGLVDLTLVEKVAPEPVPAEPETNLDGEVARKPVGSKAVVLGDAGNWDHGFAPGMVVEILIDDVDLDGSYYVHSDETGHFGHVAARDLGVYTPEPRKPQVGDRVIAIRDTASDSGRPFPKGTTMVVTCVWGDGTVGGDRDDNDGGNVPPANDLVAFEPLTSAPRAGDTVVVIDGGGNPTFDHYPVGHVGTVTSVDWARDGELGLVSVTGLDSCGAIFGRRLGRVLS